MTTHDAARLNYQGGVAPPNVFGGSESFGPPSSAVPSGFTDFRSGDELAAEVLAMQPGEGAGWLLGLSGDQLASKGHRLANGPIAAWLLGLSGTVMDGVAFQVSAFYRATDRITLSGYVLDTAGQRLRQYQLHFIGETVQDHFFGAASNLDGIYVAYLETGDSYACYAFDTRRGLTYQLERQEVFPTRTDLVFRLLTKRGGFGEGIYLQGG